MDSVVLEDVPVETDEEAEQKVQIDWVAQIKAGGFIMYPLYLLGILALVITIQRSLLPLAGVWHRKAWPRRFVHASRSKITTQL